MPNFLFFYSFLANYLARSCTTKIVSQKVVLVKISKKGLFLKMGMVGPYSRGCLLNNFADRVGTYSRGGGANSRIYSMQ